MARKEINIFGTSFLDLLSGALAAVIILFVVVPKGVQEDPELVKQVQELKTVTNDVKDAIEKIKNSVPKEVFEKIRKDIETANKKLAELNTKIEKLEEDIKKISSENTALKEKVQKQQEEIDKLKKQVQELLAQIDAVKKENQSSANTVEKALGVFARFGILCRWSETETDVDMGVQCFGEMQGRREQCWRNHPSMRWGMLGEDVRERVDEDEEERFELFYVPQIYPDIYTLWIYIFDQSAGSNAMVTCTFVFHPGKPDEVRKEVGPINLNKSKEVLVASFRLTKNGFDFINNRPRDIGTERATK